MNGVPSVYGQMQQSRRAPTEVQLFPGYSNSSRLQRGWTTPQQQRNHPFNGIGIEAFSEHNCSEMNTVPHPTKSPDSYRHAQKVSNQMLSKSYQTARRPLTKQVDQLLYELPRQNKFSINSLCQPPEFLKVFSDVRCLVGEKAVFDCVLLGSPRPRVCWLFNDEKMKFEDVFLEDTSDVCRCTIKRVTQRHYGVYAILAENEVGRAITTATLLPATEYQQF